MESSSLVYANIVFVAAAALALGVATALLGWLSGLALRAAARLPGAGRLGDLPARLRRGLRGWLLALFLVGALGLIGFGVWVTIQGRPAAQAAVELLTTSLPPGFWPRLGLALLGAVGVIAAARALTALVDRAFPALAAWAGGRAQLRASPEAIARFFERLRLILRRALWFFAAGAALWLLPLPRAIGELVFTGLRIYLIITTGQLFVSVIVPLIDTLDALSEKYVRAVSLDSFYDRLRGLVPLLSRCLEYIIYVQAATLAVLQISALAGVARYGLALVQIIALVFLSRVVIELLNLAVDRVLLTRGELSDLQWQQRRSFAPLAKSALRYSVYFGAFLLALSALGIDTGPILVAIGGLGLIVGLAAQPVLNDMISGLFILFENVYLVGDYIETSEARGIVESIDVRTTRIRGPDGQVYILRNGQIGDITNYSKDYAFAAVTIGVAYESDLDHVHRVIAGIGVRLDADREDVLEPTEVQGIEEFGDDAMLIRTVTRVRPGRHEEVARALRAMIRAAFSREGIEFASTPSMIYLGDPGAAPRPNGAAGLERREVG